MPVKRNFKSLQEYKFPKLKQPITAVQRVRINKALDVLDKRIEEEFEARRKLMGIHGSMAKYKAHSKELDLLLYQKARLEAKLEQ